MCAAPHVSDAELCRRIKAGDAEAESIIVIRYTPLVRKLVTGCRAPAQVDHDDLTQAGLLAVLHAARKWNPDRGVKFITVAWRYASRDIAKAKHRDLQQTRLWGEQDTGPRDDPNPNSIWAAPVREETAAPDGLAAGLERLEPTALVVVKLAFGFDGNAVGVVEIGKRLGLTSHEVNEVLDAALVELGADAGRPVVLPTSRPSSARRRDAQTTRSTTHFAAGSAPCG